MKDRKLPFAMDGSCNPQAVVQGDVYRFTVITERIIRLEYDAAGVFEDRPSQTVLNRNFPAPSFSVKDTGARLEIDAKHFHLTYDYGQEKRFTENSLVLKVKNGFSNYGGTWHFGETTYGDPPRHHNLMGTARTLDRSLGAVELEYGLMDASGRSFFDDSKTALFEKDGSLAPRRAGTVDVYFICCQRDYGQTLQDFYRITGTPPMLPRYALGNWWSRYYAYSADSYLALMERFRQEDIPISMAVLDMDWHITKIDPKYGRGWTGHTWNKELFPDPEGFLQQLHDNGFHTCLNLHPAEGVQAYEDGYPAMAAAMGVDTEKEEPVLFDMTDEKYTAAYFNILIRNLEKQGVDHWWIDWQQGRTCATPGMDPLWLLNHNHYADNCKDGKRGLILSRYAGLGSHRYPAGFSGDSCASWESLDFQAYFTVTATNAGFPFWSHDIGGFSGGDRDPELFTRWVQFGVFTPFMRLHGAMNPFATKEPWSFVPQVRPAIGQALRLRHKLIPYIYTAVYRQHNNQQPLICPMYYVYPGEDRTYYEQPMYYIYPNGNKGFGCKNQYFFGSELMVCPITSPADPVTNMGSVKAWIPEGIWTDFFTGKTYQGSRVTVLNRLLEQYPVLARSGAIVPTAVHAEGSNSTCNPAELEVFVFPGASGQYTMFEDDGISDGYETGKAFFTDFAYDEDKKTFTAHSRGDRSLIPENRKYKITFRGFCSFVPEGPGVERASYDPATHSVTVTMKAGSDFALQLPGAARENNTDMLEKAFQFLNYARVSIMWKRDVYAQLSKGIEPAAFLEQLHADQVDRRVCEVLTEILTH